MLVQRGCKDIIENTPQGNLEKHHWINDGGSFDYKAKDLLIAR
jgi:hypothetical protein